MINFKVGDRVQFVRPDGIKATDIIRELFVQTVLLEPYAHNTTFPAAVLTKHSWMPLSELNHDQKN